MAKEKKPSLIIKRPMEPKQGKQQTEQVERAVKGLVAMNADALQQRQKLTGEMEKCWEAFVGTVEDLDEVGHVKGGNRAGGTGDARLAHTWDRYQPRAVLSPRAAGLAHPFAAV